MAEKKLDKWNVLDILFILLKRILTGINYHYALPVLNKFNKK